jgi:hypothetical protein
MQQHCEQVDVSVTIPYFQVYGHYVRHCNDNRLTSVKAPFFDKLLHSVFDGLRTRRLGPRQVLSCSFFL